MDSIFAMGGYGAYVWSCYGLTLVIVVFVSWRGRLRQKQVYRDIEVRLKALGDRE
jgi:heme exporter protein CcmD